MKQFFFFCCLLVISTSTFGQKSSNKTGSAKIIGFTTYRPLWIPDTLSGRSFNVTIKDTFAQMRNTGNQTITGAFNNNSFWGPTFFVNKGDTVEMNILNQLNDSTTIHWHGMHLPPLMDGGPHQLIPVGATWKPYWKVLNHAGTYWFHPHIHEMTQAHVGKGLGSLLIVRDKEEQALPIPRRYGVDDIPLILSDRTFDENNQFVKRKYGNTQMVNGVLQPEFAAPAQVVRFRILGAAVERCFNVGFSDNRTFYVIASDGSLLKEPVPMSRLLISGGERFEILVDFSQDKGKMVDLIAYNNEISTSTPGGEDLPLPAIKNDLGHKNFQLLHFTVKEQTNNPVLSIPKKLLENLEVLNPADAQFTRTITVSDELVRTTETKQLKFLPVFNSEYFDMEHINFEVPFNNTEIWELRSTALTAHPYHIHGVEFMILTINGEPPHPSMAGWKDVVLIPSGTKKKPAIVRLIVKFEDYSDEKYPFMHHCHISSHEDEGMMGQFLVKNKSAAPPSNEPINFQLKVEENQLWVQLEKPRNDIRMMEIKDERGRIVQILPIPRLHKSIEISRLKKGKYTVLLTANKVYTESFVNK